MADYYLRSIGGNWTTAATWSLSDGGGAAAAYPVAGDNVFLTALSGSANLAVNAASACVSINGSAFAGTLSGAGSLTLTGSLTLGAAMTRTYTGAISLTSTAAGNTVTTNGVSLASNITCSGAGGVWTLGSALVTSGTVTLSAGSLIDGAYSVTANGATLSGAGVKVLNATAATWTLTGNSGTFWTTSGASNVTTTSMPTTLDLTGTGYVGVQVAASLTPANDIRVSGTGMLQIATVATQSARDITLTASATGLYATQTMACRDLNWLGDTGAAAASSAALSISRNLTLAAGITPTYAGAITFNGSSGTQQITTASVSLASNLVLNCSGATVKLLGNLTTSGSLTHTAGSLDVNGNTLAWSSSRSITCTEPAGGGGSAVIGSSVIVPLGRIAC